MALATDVVTWNDDDISWNSLLSDWEGDYLVPFDIYSHDHRVDFGDEYTLGGHICLDETGHNTFPSDHEASAALSGVDTALAVAAAQVTLHASADL